MNKIIDYYNSKIIEYGLSPRGVDWKNSEGQLLRFDMLLRALDIQDSNVEGSLLDFGCGNGELARYLAEKSSTLNYFGYDLSPEMIKVASRRLDILSGSEFSDQLPSNREWDFVIASGTFNVKLDEDAESWGNYVKSTLLQIKEQTRVAFAFNLLTSYSDRHLQSARLYYASPEELFEFCVTEIGRNVSIFHHYGLYEMTIGIRIGD